MEETAAKTLAGSACVMDALAEEAAAPAAPQEEIPRGRAPLVTVQDPVTGEMVTMTKTAAKKITKRALREQKKEATKHERRARERARRKEKRALAREALANDPEAAAAAAQARQKRPVPVPFDARVVVDLGFDDLMTADEATSMASQLGFLYGVNRTSSHPFKEVVFTGAGRISGQALGFDPPHGGAHAFPAPSTPTSSLMEDRVGQHMERKNGGSWRRWRRVSLLEFGGLEALWTPTEAQPTPMCASKDDVIYLTADTDDTIDALEPGKTYVIGGIVDRNRYKYLCSKKAEALGLRMARLPIDPSNLDGQRMQARKVLTVNQVFAILVGWTETRDWTAALKRGLPTRKFLAPTESDVASPSEAAEEDTHT
ncbi:hypothetical protein Malapachy_1429 [Malassezia pachydermatis]|uniref:tRNA (guanine(9)-N1)-methyltransferase n=1 Tax=Malassezia pachydermatis TaxID=77020 RepID=A0A0M8MI95_9BASI|nr:hypothetical protein Malapachy_1429 [Malassezia pachydermatis]KOS13006.1 hypothetical protein Malapachy_1429 [Malassezia pachydermatis]